MGRQENTLFAEEFENEAIERIRKFARLSEKMGYVPVLGFSGGKDSQVCYDLCKRAGIQFRAVFNHCFESAETLQFIREYYPEVEWRREVKEGFFDNIVKNHGGFVPTSERPYCCEDYKHNRKYVDSASIVGVRRSESKNRASRQVLETKNKTFLHRHKEDIAQYFSENCIASGAPSEITLKPIVDWSDTEVWEYMYRHSLPINPTYNILSRVGCLICPKANFSSNYQALSRYPKLIDAIIRVKSRRLTDWIISNDDNKDYSDNKPYWVCRWLNHSFRPFTKKQEKMCMEVIEKYKSIHDNKEDDSHE